ncbi:methyltransferase domain-containing protein [Nocardioidaceae bacterium]|nr:methyltransferase domain-containing protein [Nocardioidaceae bacterium]
MTSLQGSTPTPARRRRRSADQLPDDTRTVEFHEVFAAALAGATCSVIGDAVGEQQLPMARWAGEADDSDDTLLALCEGPTLDVGCGPGRMASRLAELGHVVLGVDIVAAAVRRTRDRGVSAIQRDLFERLPGEGRWQTALLADGNIGIGGDPVTLLARMVELVTPGGHVIVEAAPPGGGLQVHEVRLQAGQLQSSPFPWAVLAVDHVEHLVRDLPLELTEIHRIGRGENSRWVAALTREDEQ